jgi:hypothetical protein
VSNQESDKFLRSLRTNREEQEAAKKRREDECIHKAGSLVVPGSGEGFHSPLDGIAWHLFDDHVLRGVCLNCLKVFEPGDPKYQPANHHLGEMSACAPREGEQVEMTDEIRAEIATQFNDLDQYAVWPSETLREFLKEELFKAFLESFK